VLFLAALILLAVGFATGAYVGREHFAANTPNAQAQANHRDAIALARDLIRTPDALITPYDLRGRANRIITRFEAMTGISDETL
jgi:hypothetical protein